MFLVFVYVWLPYMIVPIQTALERVPTSLLEASGDLGAKPAQTFRNVILPLAFPGVVAGFDLHLLADAGRFHRPAALWQFELLHRPGGATLPGHFGQHAAGRGLHDGSDRDHDRLSAHCPRAGSLRCALVRAIRRSALSLWRLDAAPCAAVLASAVCWLIILYAFTTDEPTYSFPLPGLTLKWLRVA